MEWTTIEDRHDIRTEIAEVPGGWLYRSTVYRAYRDSSDQEYEETLSVGITFVPHPPKEHNGS